MTVEWREEGGNHGAKQGAQVAEDSPFTPRRENLSNA